MRFQRLTTDADLERFRECFRESSGVAIPLDYYQRSEIIGAFDDAGGLIGGYCLATGSALRWPNQVPHRLPFQDRVPPERTYEFNSVWLRKETRFTWVATRFWLHVSRDLGRRRGMHFTFVVDPRKTGLVRLYEKLRPEVIYDGPFQNSSLTQARIYHVKPLNFRLIGVLYAVDLLARMVSLRRAPSKAT